MAMNTRLDLLFWGLPQDDSQMAYQEIGRCLENLELLISRYHPKAELYQVNQLAYQKPLVISAALFNILEQCFGFYQKTEGYFDISLGKIYHAYKHHQENTPLHTAAKFSDQVLLNPNNHTVKLATAETELDLGGVGKGLALQEISHILEKYAIQNAFISFGGSSVLTRGRHPHGDYWPFSLSEANSDFQCQLKDDSISVSQSLVTQTNTHHIVNPKTKTIIDAALTVVVKSKNPVFSEVLSTALIAAPPERHTSLAQAFRGTDFWIFS
jgi:thiamine biosynthesis lipoprotein ApbE